MSVVRGEGGATGWAGAGEAYAPEEAGGTIDVSARSGSVAGPVLAKRAGVPPLRETGYGLRGERRERVGDCLGRGENGRLSLPGERRSAVREGADATDRLLDRSVSRLLPERVGYGLDEAEGPLREGRGGSSSDAGSVERGEEKGGR